METPPRTRPPSPRGRLRALRGTERPAGAGPGTPPGTSGRPLPRRDGHEPALLSAATRTRTHGAGLRRGLGCSLHDVADRPGLRFLRWTPPLSGGCPKVSPTEEKPCPSRVWAPGFGPGEGLAAAQGRTRVPRGRQPRPPSRVHGAPGPPRGALETLLLGTAPQSTREALGWQRSPWNGAGMAPSSPSVPSARGSRDPRGPSVSLVQRHPYRNRLLP